MRIAISNIAWDRPEDEEIAQLLKQNQIDAIDIAPGKYFPDPAAAKESEIKAVKEWWAARGIEITGMQSLLFGTTGLNLFASREIQNQMLKHLGGVCRIAGILGATRLVFGSPKNRDRSGLTDDEARFAGARFFKELGDLASQHGVFICLEPNPPCYGANFMTTTAETAQVVEETAHPSIRLQLDTGAVTINNEDVVNVVKNFGALIGHVHASEPGLVALGDGNTDHRKVSQALWKFRPQQLVSIEMVATQNEPHLVSVGRALQVAILNYRSKPDSVVE